MNNKVMKRKLKYTGRILIATLILVLYVIGYIHYEKTLIAWWCPVAIAGLAALLSLPLSAGKWHWLSGTEGKINYLCHLYGIGGICYCLILVSNYTLAYPSSSHEEKTFIMRKETTTHTIYNGSGRKYRKYKRTTRYYHFYVTFDDGTQKKVPVSLSTYNKFHENMYWKLYIQKGFLGFRVIKEPDKTKNSIQDNE